MRMDTYEPKPRGVSEFDLRLQQVFSATTSLLRGAIAREALEGGFLQRYIADEVMPVDTIAFRLTQKHLRYVDGIPVVETWVIYVPEGESGNDFLTLFWLQKEVRTQGLLNSVDTFHRFDTNGRFPVPENEELASPTNTDVEMATLLKGLDGLIDIGSAAQLVTDQETTMLEGITRSLGADFELVPFRS